MEHHCLGPYLHFRIAEVGMPIVGTVGLPVVDIATVVVHIHSSKVIAFEK